jgi:hypothetical protein
MERDFVEIMSAEEMEAAISLPRQGVVSGRTIR